MNEETTGYGYASDEVKQNPFNFGLNAGVTKLMEFKWIPNGGANGAEQEALNIVFEINGTLKSYRKFPIVKAFINHPDGSRTETTDPNAKEFRDARAELNAAITHVLKAFTEDSAIQAALSRPFKDFKEFCQVSASLLPKDFHLIPLDIFLQYQYNLSGEAKKTYLDIPANLKHGKWLVKSEKGTTWNESVVANPSDKVMEALLYSKTDAEGVIIKHPFVRRGWYMNSNFAKQQFGDGEAIATEAAGAEAQNAGTTSDTTKPVW